MKTSSHLFAKMACVFFACIAITSCKKTEIYSTTVNELQKLPKSKSISVPFDEAAVDTFAFRKEMAANLKAFIRQNKKLASSEKQVVHAENLSADSSLTVVYPEPTIDVHIPDIQNLPSGFRPLTYWSETVLHEWVVASLSWGGFNVAKIYSAESIELTGWVSEEFSDDSQDVIVYNIDRAPHAGSYTDNPNALDWEEQMHWTTYYNSELQGIAYFKIKGHARKNPLRIKEFVEKDNFWASSIISIPKQPK